MSTISAKTINYAPWVIGGALLLAGGAIALFGGHTWQHLAEGVGSSGLAVLVGKIIYIIFKKWQADTTLGDAIKVGYDDAAEQSKIERFSTTKNLNVRIALESGCYITHKNPKLDKHLSSSTSGESMRTIQESD
jgi:hypothetical protein